MSRHVEHYQCSNLLLNSLFKDFQCNNMRCCDAMMNEKAMLVMVSSSPYSRNQKMNVMLLKLGIHNDC